MTAKQIVDANSDVHLDFEFILLVYSKKSRNLKL